MSVSDGLVDGECVTCLCTCLCQTKATNVLLLTNSLHVDMVLVSHGLHHRNTGMLQQLSL